MEATFAAPDYGVPRCRLVLVETVAYQPPTGQPVCAEARTSHWLKSTEDEQPFGPRRLRIGETWQKLDFGWVVVPSMVVLANETGKYSPVVPSEAALAETRTAVLEVAFREPLQADAYVLPGLSIRMCPAAAVYARCQRGVANCMLTVFPE
jgi:hypothetical protein